MLIHTTALADLCQIHGRVLRGTVDGRGLEGIQVLKTPIEHLDLSVRVFNSLKRTGITTVGEVMDMLAKGEETMLAIRNFGDKSLDELRDKLREKGYIKDGEVKVETPAENPV